jgi:predicted permease
MTIDQFRRDVRFAVRTLARSRMFAIVAIVSLALGIGANTAMFSLVSGLLLSKPQVAASHEIIELHRRLPDGSFNSVSRHDLDDLRDGLPGPLREVAAYQLFTGQIGGAEGAGTVVLGELVDWNYFQLLGIPAAVGRTFNADEGRTKLTHPVVVLGHRFWRSQLASDPSVVGRTIRLNGRAYTVVGVAPQDFSNHMSGIHVDVWAPMMMQDHLNPSEPEWDSINAVARLAPGTTVAALNQSLAQLLDRTDAARGRSERRWELVATAFDDIIISPSFDTPLRAIAGLLLAVVALVLIVTCSNLAGFLLARAADRRKEMAVRMATGATRGAVVRQMMIESMLLAALGGALGLVLSAWLIRLILAANPPAPIPLNIEIPLDARVLLYTFGACVAASIFFGLAPALRATSVAIAPTLREESGGNSGRTGRLRSALITGQLALSLLLLICAGLFIRSMRAALDVNPGFSTAPAGILTVDLRGSGYRPDQYPEAYRQLRSAIENIPGVEQVSVSNRLPMMLMNSGTSVSVPGVDNGRGGNDFYFESAVVSPEYFDVLGIPMRQGEAFRASQAAGSQLAVILNQATAERLWPGENAVGRAVAIDGQDGIIVGVSEMARDRGLQEAARRMVFFPMLQSYTPTMMFLARGSMPAARLADDLRRVALQVNPELFVIDTKTLDEHLGVMFYLPRMAAWLMSGFAVLALTLGCIGLYGAVSHAVARRSRELAIRMALGATAREVVALVVRGSMMLVVAGTGAGLALAAGASSFLSGFLIGGRGFDPVIFTIVPLALGGVALLASWLPARRAGRVSPISALRAE